MKKKKKKNFYAHTQTHTDAHTHEAHTHTQKKTWGTREAGSDFFETTVFGGQAQRQSKLINGVQVSEFENKTNLFFSSGAISVTSPPGVKCNGSLVMT
uniref:Uncharacterized protein n=1 Tax=Anguilla anguilla TaxID=7936 RepID=A0A0E9X147_ANGAN